MGEKTGVFYYQNDHLGTPQRLLDKNGAVVWAASYSAFGEAAVSVAEVTSNLRFPGQYFDRETGLHYNYFRDYDPELGRYVQEDPIGMKAGPNSYAYSDSSPLNYYDALGLNKDCPLKLFDNCVSRCLQNNYGSLYTLSSYFDPLGALGITTVNVTYSYITETVTEPRINRNHYTHNSSRHAAGLRQARVLSSLRLLNAVGWVAAAFATPFTLTANEVCKSRCSE